MRRTAPWIAATGLVVVVAGTFLPWFHSGSVGRHSYQAAGLVGRHALFANAFVDAALRVWLAVPLISCVCLGLLALGFRIAGGTLGTLLAISVGTVALLATVQSDSGQGLVGISIAGPVTTLVGACVALAGALGTAFTARRHLRSSTRN